MSPVQLASERDALRKAIDLAHEKIAEALSARKHAEARVVALEARVRSQRTKLESMHHRLERQSARHGHHIQRAHRISVLESRYQQCMVDNRVLRSRLLDFASRRHSPAKACGGTDAPPPSRAVTRRH